MEQLVAVAMENTESKMKKKILVMDAFKETVSPLLANMDGNQVLTAKRPYHLTMPQVLDSYAENLDLASPIVRYFRGGSPMAGTILFPDDPVTSSNGSSKHRAASAGTGSYGFSSRGSLSVSPLSMLDNLKIVPKVRSAVMCGSTLKGDDDVFVMDDVQVMSKLGGRCALSFSAPSFLSFGIALKSEMSDAGTSRRKCKASNGKEDLRSARCSPNNLAGGKNRKYRSRAMGGSSSMDRIAFGLKNAVLAMEGRKIMTPPGSHHDSGSATEVQESPATLKNWLPQDDGIEVVLPNFPTDKTPEREDVEAYFQGVLYAPNNEKRLPAFSLFCPI